MILTSKVLMNVAFQLSTLIIIISITTYACSLFANPCHVLCEDIFPSTTVVASYVVIMFINRNNRKSFALLCQCSYVAVKQHNYSWMAMFQCKFYCIVLCMAIYNYLKLKVIIALSLNCKILRGKILKIKL